MTTVTASDDQIGSEIDSRLVNGFTDYCRFDNSLRDHAISEFCSYCFKLRTIVGNQFGLCLFVEWQAADRYATGYSGYHGCCGRFDYVHQEQLCITALRDCQGPIADLIVTVVVVDGDDELSVSHSAAV